MMPGAGLAHLPIAIALGQHHQRAAGRLKLIDIGIHPARRGRAKRAGGETLRRLGGTRVIDRMILEIRGHGFACLQPCPDFRMGEIARDDHLP